MFLTLTALAALISIMFVFSVLAVVSELHRENEDLRQLHGRDRTF